MLKTQTKKHREWSSRPIIIIVIVCAVIILFFQLGKMFAPGSYPYAEWYKLNIDEPALIEIVKEFKRQTPIYDVPMQVRLEEGRRGKSDHWYHIYFYYPEENQIIHSWIRQNGTNETVLAFVGVNDGLYLGNWREINHDFSGSENREQKRMFEERILNKIKAGIPKK